LNLQNNQSQADCMCICVCISYLYICIHIYVFLIFSYWKQVNVKNQRKKLFLVSHSHLWIYYVCIWGCMF
jgi:hypothetical protein